ncbi:MAG: 3-dehydroquinate synthase [Proteobacteria bacterium]|nr:3-dehydroquinate synthase [Pseudomonadota bacterium]
MSEGITWVNTPAEKYPIYVGQDLLSQTVLFEPYLAHRQVLIVSHPDVAQCYAQKLSDVCLQTKALSCQTILIPNGDEFKTLDTAGLIWSTLVEANYHRQAIIIALGGGMVGDIAGFSAACYMRGIDYVQCPTTLLAQIDAAIGGKTAINLPSGKNLIGAFHQPKAVFCDLLTLKTLKQREYIAGLAELIKYGMALDTDFFVWIEENLPHLLARDHEALLYAIQKAVSLKAKIVSVDEKDNASRRLLNFGHTLAHALESLLDYRCLLHGEAVAIGMVAATYLSVAQTRNKNMLERLILVLERVGLPTKIPSGITIVEILTKMKHDKKNMSKGLQWIVPDAIGQTRICEVKTSQITQALMFCGAIA